MALTDKLTAIADAVRTKTGKTAKLTLDTMVSDLNAISNRTSSDLTASGATVTVPAGNYKSQVTKSVATVTRASTSISTSVDDTNDKITLTASNNQGTGYVTGSNQTATKTITLTASGATVTASDGSESISKSVATATQATPSVSINSSGLITATATQTAGYVSAGTKSGTKQLTVQAAKTVTPNTSEQTAVASGVYTTGAVTVAAIPTVTRANTTISVSADDTNDKLTITASNNQGTGYVTGANKTASTTISLTASGATVTASDGTNSVSKSVATATRADTTISVSADDTNDKLTITASNNQGTGYVTGSNKTATKTITLTASGSSVTASDGTNKVSKSVATATQATPSISINSSGKITASATQTAGYVSAGTKTGTKQLTTQAAKTITPSTSSQTAVASGVYTTGAVTVAAIPSTYKNTSDATAAAENILSGKTAYTSSGKIAGTMPDRNIVEQNGAGMNATYPNLPSNPTTSGLQYCTNTDGVNRICVRPPYGYYDGSSYVSVPASSFGTAEANQVLSGVTFTSASGLSSTGTLDATAAALNFKVVGGTSTPSNPTENTIWVNTSTAVSSWDFSATEPPRRSNNKNLVVYPYSEGTKTTNGITYTVNSDGSIKASGTPSATAWFTVCNTSNLIWLEPGTYTFSGCPNGGGASKVKMALRPQDGGSDITDGGTGGVTFTLTKRTAFQLLMAIYTAAGTVSNLVFKPQLEVGSTATSFVKGDATGHVWISTGTSSTAEFNALKKNGIQVCPKSAKQYINNAWVAKTGQIYQSNTWKGWAHYLIGNGVDAQTVTGDFYIYDGFRTFNSDGSVFLRHPYADATNKHDYATNNTFDVTNYTKLVVHATEWDTNEAFYVGVNTVANKGQNCISRVAIGNVPATVTLDISSITGYVCFQVDMPYYGTSITLSEVYFE